MFKAQRQLLLQQNVDIFSFNNIYFLKCRYLNFTSGRVNERGKKGLVMPVPSCFKKGDKRHWPYLREEDIEINIFKFQ